MTTPPSPTDARKRPRPRRAVNPWNALLFVPLITLLPQLYNHREPALWGFPFFYWYQLLWIGIGVACTVTVYRHTRGDR